MISLVRTITRNFSIADNIPKKRQIALNWLNKGEIILAKITGLILITTGLILALNLVWPLFVNISNIFNGIANKINPSINNNNPKAVISSLIKILI